MFERFGRVVKAEIGHLVRRSPSDAGAPSTSTRPSVSATTPRGARQAAVVDVEGALRVLELSGSPALADVRAQYRMLARRYHPKTRSPAADEAHSARVVLDALTDALELLEAHLLPV